MAEILALLRLLAVADAEGVLGVREAEVKFHLCLES